MELSQIVFSPFEKKKQFTNINIKCIYDPIKIYKYIVQLVMT
jgi:hypothetical protein